MPSLIPVSKLLESRLDPLISAMCGEICLTEILDQLIPWGET